MAQLKIKWTRNAEIELAQILDYLEKQWTNMELRKFATLLEKNLSIITLFPRIFPASTQNNSVRRCIVSKQTSLYYKVEQDKIIVLSLFDNRRNPSTLQL